MHKGLTEGRVVALIAVVGLAALGALLLRGGGQDRPARARAEAPERAAVAERPGAPAEARLVTLQLDPARIPPLRARPRPPEPRVRTVPVATPTPTPDAFTPPAGGAAPLATAVPVAPAPRPVVPAPAPRPPAAPAPAPAPPPAPAEPTGSFDQSGDSGTFDGG